jgi:hypothetical protein
MQPAYPSSSCQNLPKTGCFNNLQRSHVRIFSQYREFLRANFRGSKSEIAPCMAALAARKILTAECPPAVVARSTVRPPGRRKVHDRPRSCNLVPSRHIFHHGVTRRAAHARMARVAKACRHRSDPTPTWPGLSRFVASGARGDVAAVSRLSLG